MTHLILLAILTIGTALRFGNLAAKPMWVDEVFTALFSLGQSFDRLPLGEVIPVEEVKDLFQLQPGVGCGAIAQHLTLQSTHPPLFFCLMNRWLWALQGTDLPLLWQLRALPALFGIGAIAAVYGVGKLAFNRKAGLWGAAFMAVSPFGVYQSQEARHYTLPILLITGGLGCLFAIHRDLRQKRFLIWPFLGLVLFNSLGLYVHYFHFIAWAGQGLTLLVILWINKAFKLKIWILSAIAFLLPVIFYWPWWSILRFHFNNPKASWLPEPSHITPLLQMLMSVVLTMVAPPVERQPLGVMIGAGAIALIFVLWLFWQIGRGWRLLQKQYPQESTILMSFMGVVLLQFLVIIYGLGKDISVAPRYHFVYYSALCVVIGGSLQQLTSKQIWQHPGLIALLGGFLSSLLVIFNLSFLKPYHPLPVARQLQGVPQPSIVVMAYHYPLDIALGLSYALALDSWRSPSESAYFLFLDNQQGYNLVWQSLEQDWAVTPQSLWVFGPGLIAESYPETLRLSPDTLCHRDPQAHYRVGVPYQLYDCGRSPQNNF
ncbi:MAG: hypothetical protein ACLFV6_01080 [Spirulinaceae cyanobacterium]